MHQGKKQSMKLTTLAFLWGAMFFSFMIRYALGVAAPTLMRLYHLSPKTMGYVLSGWQWSYTGALAFVGPIVDRFGPWAIMGIGSAIWGLSTVALPVATGASSLILMRLFFGFGNSMLICSTATSVSRAFNARERTRAMAVAFSGNDMGLAAGAAVATLILARFGWQAVFYCIGGASLLWTLAWFRLYPDKRIGSLGRIQSSRAEISDFRRLPWTALFRSRSTWGIGFGQMGYLYVYNFFVSWLPAYLILDRKMTILNSGIIAALPFWMGFVCNLAGGWLGDDLIRRGIRPTVSRKSIIGAGLVGATALLVGVAYVQQSWLVVAFVILTVGCLRMTTASVNSLPIDLAPPSAVGSLTAIQNFFGNIGGLLAPIVTGYLFAATKSFIASFLVAGGMATLGAISYIFIVGNLENSQEGSETTSSTVTVVQS
jgi:MFS transporter, ACS family, D-galactonate transporter